MKKRLLTRLLCMLLISAMFITACGSKDEPEENTDRRRSEQNSETEVTSTPDAGKVTDTPEPATGTEDITSIPEVTIEPSPEPHKLSYFDSYVESTDRMLKEAVEQYNAHDYTNLDEPVKYYVLWLGFTHVTYGDLDFQMTDFDREYLQAVALNYEKCLESITSHNLDITVDLQFVDDVTPLTKWYDDDWL
ncbi:MAG: hypothetical protein IKO54_01640, partial [Lachnospiraceae bacterium]|nr:hypothetical protein [Lachnospiraceae bacterium]